MKRKNIQKLALITLIILNLGLLTVGNIKAMVDEAEKPKQDNSDPQGLFRLSDSHGIPQGSPGKPSTPEYAPGQLIVKLKQDKTLEDIRELKGQCFS